ncbi:hypothetical protein LTR27_005841 [Elasticomyces elasticus]|nr:hypothetical protein LTR27_005841 [Elasticomyces elasticus]
MAFELREPDAVAEKVMRRAQVSKMTRALQDRLALASVKIQNGWENMSLDAIEPQLEQRRMSKRPASSIDTVSDTASTTSSSRVHSSLASSPLTAPMFSDDHPRSGGAYKRQRASEAQPQIQTQRGASSGAMRSARRPRMTTRSASWKTQHSLAESSPIDHAKHARYPSHNVSHLSFISEGSTVPDSPPSPAHSEDDDADIPVTSFSLNTSTRITSITTSPPHTPPQDRRMRKAHNVSWSRTPKHGDGGADLLMFLAGSPSSQPTIKEDPHRHDTLMHPPTTPPCKPTPLPSSHMTPSASGGFMGFGPHTPGTNNFNFADFVNVTPSPAQGAWVRTPNAGRTPAAARAARRKLNFDTMLPPTSSPVMTRSARKSEGGDGLGMELGGDLM